jgi:hypothetical protein
MSVECHVKRRELLRTRTAAQNRFGSQTATTYYQRLRFVNYRQPWTRRGPRVVLPSSRRS